MTDKFHKHLDECERCRTQPFNLCAIGDKLLREAAENAMNTSNFSDMVRLLVDQKKRQPS